MLFGLLKRAAYDTAVYSDRMTQLRYPMVRGESWLIRSKTDPGGNWVLKKEFLGLDTLEFEGRDLQCARFALHSVVDLISWVSHIGLLKAEIDFGKSAWEDTLGNFVDSVATREDYTLLALDPTEAELDSLKSLYRSRFLDELTQLR